jgi:hypothetical protein
MYKPGRDEKTTPVMVYARNKLVHGELVTKKEIRASIWLRTQSLPHYIHFLNAQVWFFGGTPPQSLEYSEYFFPSERIIGFLLDPPAAGQPAADPEQLDYDPSVPNRAMIDVECILGAFILKGRIRISDQIDLPAAIEKTHLTWLSVYDADISSPFLKQMPVIHVPFLWVNPSQVSFGFQ